MTGHARISIVAGALALAASVTGCGSGSHGGDGVENAFLRSVDAVCAKVVAAHTGHDFPLQDFDPESPDPSLLPVVGDYFAQYGGLPTTTAALHATHPPAKDVSDWRAVLSDADRLTSNSERHIRAARAQDARTFVTTVHIANALTDKINSDAGRLGMTGDSPCHQVYG